MSLSLNYQIFRGFLYVFQTMYLEGWKPYYFAGQIEISQQCFQSINRFLRTWYLMMRVSRIGKAPGAFVNNAAPARVLQLEC